MQVRNRSRIGLGLATLFLLPWSITAWSAGSEQQEQQKEAKIEAMLKAYIPNGKPDSIGESVVPGLYEAVYGAQVIYVTSDARYMFEGDVYDVKERKNITEGKRQAGRMKVVDNINKDTYIEFKPKGETKYLVTAFTDIDCGYCRKLHKEMSKYNKLGIEIRYASFPRSGPNTKSFYKAVNVWCAKDQQKAMTFAKSGATLEQLNNLEKVDGKKCDDIIRTQYQTARQIGVTGTPTLVMSDGQVIPGYVPADRLLDILKRQN